MKIKRLISILSGIILAVLLFGCQKVTEELAGVKPEGVDTLMIKIIPKSSSNPVFLSAKVGALEAALDLSDKYRMLDVQIDWQSPEVEDASAQAELIRSAIKDGTDAIIVSCSDRDSLTQAIDKAVDSGIPVMTFDSDSPDSKRFAFYGPDDVEMGKILMKKLAELIDNKGTIAILGGNQQAPNLQQRIKGVKDAAVEFPNIKITGEYYHPETEADALEQMLTVQKQNPDLKGWAMVGSWPFFGDKLLGRIEPGKIKIVAVDALPVELKYIEKNYVQVLLGQPTFRWGKVSVETVVDKIYLKKKINKIMTFKPIPVTIENLGGWSRQLKAWGYKDIPEKYLPM
jgi:ribose transport system substrate-binding protein